MYAAVVLVVDWCGECASSSRRREQRSDYYQYQYDSQAQAVGSDAYSYSDVEDYDVPVEPNKCYWCEYTVLAGQNHHEGVEQCQDPFTGQGVWEMECNGPCAVRIYTSNTTTQFMPPA